MIPLKAQARTGRLTLLEPHYHGRSQFWLVRCDCGTEKLVRAGNLRQGYTKSCGCLRTEVRVQVMARAFNPRYL